MNQAGNLTYAKWQFHRSCKSYFFLHRVPETVCQLISVWNCIMAIESKAYDVITTYMFLMISRVNDRSWPPDILCNGSKVSPALSLVLYRCRSKSFIWNHVNPESLNICVTSLWNYWECILFWSCAVLEGVGVVRSLPPEITGNMSPNPFTPCQT